MPDGGTHKFTPDKNHFCTHVSRDGPICGASLNQSCHYPPEPPVAALNGESMKADKSAESFPISELTFDEFQSMNIERCRRAFPMCDDWTLNDWAVALY